MKAADRIAQELTKARDAYYNGSPLMSDEKFDRLEAQLRLLDSGHPFFSQVGASVPAGGWPKVRHVIPMGSQNKAQSKEDMEAWHRNIGSFGACNLIVMDKLDGISISLRYEDGQLVQAVTRGDGVTGEDITRNVRMMNVPTEPYIPDCWIRGEIVCKKTDFIKHFAGESNPRNTASGTAKRQTDPSKCKHLTVVAFEYLPDTGRLKSKGEELILMESCGFSIPDFEGAADLGIVFDVYSEYLDRRRDLLDYDIDGLIVRVDNNDVWLAVGEKNHRPAGSIAYKFPHDSKETTLTGITWQVGNSGRVTPVAEFQAVNLAGANVSRASLHNVRNIKDLAGKHLFLTAGDTILVSRRNDVIPYVESLVASVDGANPEIYDQWVPNYLKVRHSNTLTNNFVDRVGDLVGLTDDELLAVPNWSRKMTRELREAQASCPVVIPVPTNCPCCNTSLETVGEYLMCRGENCPAQVGGSIKRWVKKVGILQWGSTIIDHLVEEGLVDSIADLYELDDEMLSGSVMNGRKVGSTALPMLQNLHAKKELPLHVLVGSLGIDLWGRSMCKKLVDQGYDTLEKMQNATAAEIAALPQMGQTKAHSFVDGLKAQAGNLRGILLHITIKPPCTGPLKGLTVCMTGFRDADMHTAIEQAGGTVKGSVSKGLSFLVLKDINSTSSKAKKAKAQGTQCIGIEHMWGLLGGRP